MKRGKRKSMGGRPATIHEVARVTVRLGPDHVAELEALAGRGTWADAIRELLEREAQRLRETEDQDPDGNVLEQG